VRNRSQIPGTLRFGSLSPWLALGTTLFALMGADAPKDQPKIERPQILLSQPLGISLSESNRITVRGRFLTNATEVFFHCRGASNAVPILSRGPAKAIDGINLDRVGDQFLELTITPPQGSPDGTNATLVVVTEGGQSLPHPLFLLPNQGWVNEKEPNSGFQEAPALESSQIIRGALESNGDVDVFQCEIRAGDQLRVEVFADRLGSTLDGSLAIYDTDGNLLITNDDTHGRDPLAQWLSPKIGRHFIALSSVNERAAATHSYLLRVQIQRGP